MRMRGKADEDNRGGRGTEITIEGGREKERVRERESERKRE